MSNAKFEGRTQQDCNWIVKQALADRARLLEVRMVGVDPEDLVKRTEIFSEVALMDHNEVIQALKQSNITKYYEDRAR